LLRLSCETAKNRRYLLPLCATIAENTQLRAAGDSFEEYLLLVLLYEQVFGRGVNVTKVGDDRLLHFAAEIRKNRELITNAVIFLFLTKSE
jgi:hypothetical protein